MAVRTSSQNFFAVGGEVQVNTQTLGGQSDAGVTHLANGGYIVTWTALGDVENTRNIYGQRYTATGAPDGSEFVIATEDINTHPAPSVTGLDDGGFVVTWYSKKTDTYSGDIYGQRFDETGAPEDGEFVVNTTTSGWQRDPSMTALEGGGFVVTWMSYGQDGSAYGIYGQRYTTSGALVGDEFQINTTTISGQLFPSIAALNDGGFVVSWDSWNEDGSRWDIYGQRFDASGLRTGVEFLINSETSDDQQYSALTGLSDGGFVVTWQSQGQDRSGSGIYGQRYDAAGEPNSKEFQINTTTAQNQEFASVTVLDGIGFVVTWESNYQVLGQLYDTDGEPDGSEFLINTTTTGRQRIPSVIAFDDGSIVVVWNTYDLANRSTGIFSQHFEPNSPSTGDIILSGITSEGEELTADTSAIADANGLGEFSYIWLRDGEKIVGARTSTYILTLADVGSKIAVQISYEDTIGTIETITSDPVNIPITGTDAVDRIAGTTDGEEINGLGGSDWITPGGGSDTIDGGAGNDMVSFVNLADTPGRTNVDYRLDIDLSTGTATNHDGSEQLQLSNVERITGTIFADRIKGDAGDNHLRGLGDYDWFTATSGNDTLEGGTGQDMVSYVEWLNTDANVAHDFFSDTGAPPVSGNVTGVVVDLNDTSKNTNLAAGHTYDSIERITGSGRQDVFYGDGSENDFRGLGDYDWFVGSSGGRERYFGGDGIDTVTYFMSTERVIANLRNGALVNGEETGYGSAGDATRDLYFEIENLIGTNFNDKLTGNSGRNQLSGLDGDDFIFGYGGIDQLKGGLGNDTLNGGAGSDYAYFNGAYADYTLTRTANKSVTITGPDGTDLITDVEYFVFGDTTIDVWSIPFLPVATNDELSPPAQPDEFTLFDDHKLDLVTPLTDGSLLSIFTSNFYLSSGETALHDPEGNVIASGNLLSVGASQTQQIFNADLIALDNGHAVAAWVPFGKDKVLARIYDGTAWGDDFGVYSISSETNFENVSVTDLPNGNLFFAFSSEGAFGDASGTAIKGIIRGQDGGVVVPEFRINEMTYGNQKDVHVASLSGGKLAVSWITTNDEGRAQAALRIYNDDGTPASAEIHIATSYRLHEVIALSDDRVLITYSLAYASGEFAVIYNADGTVAGEPFLGIHTAGFYDVRAVEMADGNLFFAWEGVMHPDNGGHDLYDRSVRGQIFTTDGTEVTDSFGINQTLGRRQHKPELIALGSGEVMVTWSDESGSVDRTQARYFQPDGTPGRVIEAATDEDTVLEIAAATLLANDTDPLDRVLSISEVSGTSMLGATVTLQPDGNLTYDPTEATELQELVLNSRAQDSFTYTVSDGSGGTAQATVTLDVAGLDEAVAPLSWDWM